MPNDDLDLSSCYHDSSGKREFDRSSTDGLRKSLNHCHMVNQRLIAANSALAGKVAKLEKRDTVKTILLWVTGTAATALWGVVLAIGPEVLKCVLNR